MQINSINIINNIKEIGFLLDISIGSKKRPLTGTGISEILTYSKNNISFQIIHFKFTGKIIKYKGKYYSIKPFINLLT